MERNAVNVTEDLCSGNRLFELLYKCISAETFLKDHQKSGEEKE